MSRAAECQGRSEPGHEPRRQARSLAREDLSHEAAGQAASESADRSTEPSGREADRESAGDPIKRARCASRRAQHSSDKTAKEPPAKRWGGPLNQFDTLGESGPQQCSDAETHWQSDY